MKLTKTQENKLAKAIAHITGECFCLPSSKTCAYWHNVDKADCNWQTELIIKEIKKI